MLVLTLVLSLAACNSGDDDTDTDTDTGNDVQEDAGDDAADDADDTADDADDADDTASDNDDTEEASEPKVLNLIESSNIPALITWKATDSVSFGILGNINSGLYTLGEGGVPVPDIAESVDISPDGLTYTFTLRDADWSTLDGEVYAPVTAHDFVFAWKKLLDPAEAAQYASMISTAAIKNGKEAYGLTSDLINYEKDLESLETMSVDDFEDTDDASAQDQFDEAKASLEATIAEKEAGFADKYGSIEGAKEALSELRDNLGVTAVDDKTLKVELSNPVPYFIDLMTFPSFFPASEAFYTEMGDAYGKSNDAFLYNGAFIFKEWKLSERHYLTKNPNYWDAANVALDAVDFRVIEGVSNDTSVQMYLDGEIQSTGLSGENVEKYGNRPDMITLAETVLFYVELNQGKGEAKTTKQMLAIPEARRAVNMAIDKTYITDVIFANGSLPADFFVPKGFVGSASHDNKGFREVAEDMFGGGDGYNSYDPDKAAELWQGALDEVGVDSLEFELLIYQGESAAQVGTHIKNELEKNLPGLSIVVQALPFSEKLSRADNGDYEMNWAGWGPDYPDAMTWMDMWVTGGGYNATGYSSEEYDAVIEEAKSGALTAPDKQKERFEALVELEHKLLAEDQVIVPLYQRSGIGLRDPKIENMYLQTFGPDYIYKWVDFAK